MKKCMKCKNEKPLEEFNWKNKKKGLRQPYCRDCQRNLLKETYRRNKEYYYLKKKEEKEED